MVSTEGNRNFVVLLFFFWLVLCIKLLCGHSTTQKSLHNNHQFPKPINVFSLPPLISFPLNHCSLDIMLSFSATAGAAARTVAEISSFSLTASQHSLFRSTYLPHRGRGEKLNESKQETGNVICSQVKSAPTTYWEPAKCQRYQQEDWEAVNEPWMPEYL